MTRDEETMLLSVASVLDGIDSEVYALTRDGDRVTVTTPTKQFEIGCDVEKP